MNNEGYLNGNQELNIGNPQTMHLLQSPKLPLSLITIFIIIAFASPLSFNYDGFSHHDPDIQYERATVINNAIQLTRLDLVSFGRATYAIPLHLGKKASGTLTDFTTHFSFIIDSKNQSAYADGIAFFLLPFGSPSPLPPTGPVNGSSLGLTTDNETLNSRDNTFVAVEFDIYQNLWDPPHDHVGIDINSMKSVKNISWWSSILDGKKIDAWISYVSRSKNLSIIFTGFVDNTIVQQGLYFIVDLRDYLPEWVNIGFSAATGNASAIQTILSWNFNSTMQFHGIKRNTNLWLVLGPILGVICLIILPALVFRHALWTWWSRLCSRVRGTVRYRDVSGSDMPSRSTRTEGNANSSAFDAEFERSRGPRKFSYEELAGATNNFAEEKLLGTGGFGAVYEGSLEERPVAVKKIPGDTRHRVKGYASEVRVISQLRHRNLVELIGWCHEEGELMLVYDFMHNRSLDLHLFYPERFLEWDKRYKIVQGLAAALRYLHEECKDCVVHRDIKSSNVMLDSDFNAELGDFGLARIVRHGQEVQTSVGGGTLGYMAPECFGTGTTNKESDVYSFGVVALEIACGKKAIFRHHGQSNQMNLVSWVSELYRARQIFHAADPRLVTNFDQQQMERLMMVGLWCAQPNSASRPKISQAFLVLNFEAELPELPATMPRPTSSTPPLNEHTSSTASSSYATPPMISR